MWEIEPGDTGIPKVPAVNERETIYQTASDDEPPIHAMDDGSLLFVRVDGVIVDMPLDGAIGIEFMTALNALIAKFLVGLVIHDGGWSRRTRRYPLMGLRS